MFTVLFVIETEDGPMTCSSVQASEVPDNALEVLLPKEVPIQDVTEAFVFEGNILKHKVYD